MASGRRTGVMKKLVRYYREFLLLFTSVIIIFLVFSLLSFSPDDKSFLYQEISDHPLPIHNWCGRLGSIVALLCFWMIGVAAYILPLCGIIIMQILVQKKSWHQEWDRLVACGVILMAGATIGSILNYDVHHVFMAGGFIGNMLSCALLYWCDRWGSLIILYAIMAAALMIAVRVTWIECIMYVSTFCRTCILFCVKYRIYHVMTSALGMTYLGLTYPIRWLVSFIIQVWNGSLCNGTTIMLPDDAVASSYEQAIPMNPRADEIMIHDTIPCASRAPGKERAKASSTTSFELPSIQLFNTGSVERHDGMLKKELEQRAHILEEKLTRFGVKGSVVSIRRGPVVTLFEYQPDIDTKLSRIIALEDDLAMALQALSIRIIAPIPGKAVVGFEVANIHRKDVLFGSLARSAEFAQADHKLPLVLGEDTMGNNIVVDLARMPHLLVAGSTGSGKSVALNAMLMSLVCKRTIEELRLVLIDPKRLEFAAYADIGHLLFPLVTDAQKAITVLRWVVHEMERRYILMAQENVRNVVDYDQLVCADRSKEKLPYIVVIIDELSDLMMTAGKDIEDLITRIAQMARAAGIHMIVATQRPSVDVITGLIKVNFPSRISFRVTSKIDSRTILDCNGADKLLGRGDMLFLNSQAASLMRIHGAYVSLQEIELIVAHIRQQQAPQYIALDEMVADVAEEHEDAHMIKQVIQFLHEIDEVSISLLQRRFRIGYNRAARIIEMLEAQGRIMPASGTKLRKVIK